MQTAGGSRAFRAFPGRSPPTWARRRAPRAPRGRSWRRTARLSAGNATPDFTPRAVSLFYLRTGNWSDDDVFCSQEPRLVLRVPSVSSSTRAARACATRAPRGRIRPSRVPRDASSASPGPSRGSARRRVSRVPPGLSRVAPARPPVRCVSPFYLRMGDLNDN